MDLKFHSVQYAILIKVSQKLDYLRVWCAFVYACVGAL